MVNCIKKIWPKSFIKTESFQKHSFLMHLLSFFHRVHSFFYEVFSQNSWLSKVKGCWLFWHTRVIKVSQRYREQNRVFWSHQHPNAKKAQSHSKIYQCQSSSMNRTGMIYFYQMSDLVLHDSAQTWHNFLKALLAMKLGCCWNKNLHTKQKKLNTSSHNFSITYMQLTDYIKVVNKKVECCIASTSF